MKTIFTILLALVTQQFLNAQLTFQNTYGASTSTDEGMAVVATSTGYVVAGNTNNIGKDVVLFKTDLMGNLSWSKQFQGTQQDYVYDMKSTFDGGFILAGETRSFPSSIGDSSNAFLMKVDNTGNILWSKTFGGNGKDGAYAVAQCSDSGFVATGYTNSFGAGNEDVLVFRVDKNGNQVWKESIGGIDSDFGRAITPTASGAAFVISGNTNGFSSNGNVIYTMKISNLGTLIWSKTYDFNVTTNNRQRFVYDITVNGNNQYIVVGTIGKGSLGDAQAFAMSTDSTGANVNWNFAYFQNSGDCSAHSIEHTSDGGYVLGGTMGNYYPSMIKIDSVGNRLWDKYYSSSTFTVQGNGMGATEDANGQFICVGRASVPPQTDTSILLIKADSLGVVYCNSNNTFLTNNTSDSVIINAVVSSTVFGGNTAAIVWPVSSGLIPTGSFCNSGVAENMSNKIIFTLSPNPFSTSAILSSNGNLPQGTILRIFDSFGKLVLEKTVSGTSIEISRESLSSGLYFYSVIGKEEIVSTGKFIVE